MSKEENSIFKQLGEIGERVKDIPHIKKQVDLLGKKVAVLEVKSGIWGAVAGIVSSMGTILILYLKKIIAFMPQV